MLYTCCGLHPESVLGTHRQVRLTPSRGSHALFTGYEPVNLGILRVAGPQARGSNSMAKGRHARGGSSPTHPNLGFLDHTTGGLIEQAGAWKQNEPSRMIEGRDSELPRQGSCPGGKGPH
jgi:hypothetical protein